MAETITCARRAHDWVGLSSAFVGLKPLQYPYMLRLRSGGTLRLTDYSDLSTAWVVLFGGEYVIPQDARCIVDLGANIGAFTLLAATLAPQAEVLAIEPFEPSFERLNETVHTNGLADRVQTLQAAVAPTRGEVAFDASEKTQSHSRRLITDGGRPTTEVQALTLLDVLEQAGKRVDLVKMDIEHAERAVLCATPPDRAGAMQRLVLEYHRKADVPDLNAWARAAGLHPIRAMHRESNGILEWHRL